MREAVRWHKREVGKREKQVRKNKRMVKDIDYFSVVCDHRSMFQFKVLSNIVLVLAIVSKGKKTSRGHVIIQGTVLYVIRMVLY